MKKINQIFWVAFMALTLTACGSKSQKFTPTIKFDKPVSLAIGEDSVECYAIDSTMAIPYNLNSLAYVEAKPVKIIMYLGEGSGGKTILYQYACTQSRVGLKMKTYAYGNFDTAVISDQVFTSTDNQTGQINHFGGEKKVIIADDKELYLIFESEDEASKVLNTLTLWKQNINYQQTQPITHVM